MIEALQTVEDLPALPTLEEMADDLRDLAGRNRAAALCLAASTNGVFTHPDGREAVLIAEPPQPSALAMVARLASKNTADISVDVGFGMGISSLMAVAAQSELGRPFKHYSFDPYGLGPDGKAGEVVQQYLEAEFADAFTRVWKPSEIGLGKLIEERGYGSVGYVFIDGSHTFENAMTDFVLADKLCGLGGHIIFDDAYFPAIEGVVEYIRSNRPDYAVWHLIVDNTTVIRRIAWDRREWDAFEPFAVPDRRNWTPLIPHWEGALPPSRRSA
jgi:hypothetical protein